MRKFFSICLAGLATILFAIVMLLMPNQPLASTVCACTPPPGGHPVYSVAERTDAAGVVLEGTVTEVTGDFFFSAVVAVERYFKNRGPETATIANLGSSSLCLSMVVVGQEGVFYTYGNPDTGLSANYLSAGDAVDPATAEVADQVIAAVGHAPVPPYAYHAYLPIFQVIE